MKLTRGKTLLIVFYFLLWVVFFVLSTTVIYAFGAFIQKPGQDFGFQPYGFARPYLHAVILEIIVALMISFLNVRNEMKNREKPAGNDFEDAMEAQKNTHRTQPKYLSQYFVRNFIVFMALFGAFNFGCLTDFDGKMISKAILMPSLPIAATTGFFMLVYIIKRTKRQKETKKISERV